jgi:hypothetical protein
MHREIRAQLFDGPPTNALNLRAVGFHAADRTLVEGDEFDERSVHIVFREDSRIAAYGRLTIGAPGIFSTWKDAVQVPSGSDIADLGRCCVHQDYHRTERMSPEGSWRPACMTWDSAPTAIKSSAVLWQVQQKRVEDNLAMQGVSLHMDFDCAASGLPISAYPATVQSRIE